jgi:hypothetical protein
MLIRRSFVLVASLVAAAFASTPAWSAAYPLAAGGGSGLQYHIGGGLALPIQAKITVPFPTTMQLLVPPVGGATSPTGFVLQTSGPDPKNITINYPILAKPAAWNQVGVFKDNPGIFEVATNLSVQLPQDSATAMLGLGLRTGATTTTFTTPFAPGNNIRYSNVLGQRFGGPARFFVGNPGTKPAGALFTGANATVWARAGGAPGVPPCVHPAFGGANPACVAIMINAAPNPTATAAVWGAPVGATVSTPGGTPMALVTSPGATMTAKPKKGPEPGIMVVSAPTTMGLVNMSAFTAPAPTAMTGLTNMAASTGYPWTTGMLTLAAPAAPGGGEIFMITGMDSRVGGVGAIQLVAGTLSRRTTTGPNANRAWLRLALPEPSTTFGALCALGMLALCHALARKRSR